jgi:Rad3-related DNA helicase
VVTDNTDTEVELEPVLNEEDPMNRDHIINWLTTNCDCWKGQSDRQTLEKLSDEKLKQLKANEEKAQRNAEQVANAAKKGFKDRGCTYTFNADKGRFMRRGDG